MNNSYYLEVIKYLNVQWKPWLLLTGAFDDNDMKITKAQIGKAGELLVQQKILLYGIESASLTTDSGIDLVAYSAIKQDAITIQVKTNLKAKPRRREG